MHDEKCEKKGERQLQISCDGMSESKSTSISLDVYSSRFKDCQVIFPHRIVRPLGKFKVDNKKQLSIFLEDLTKNYAQVMQYLADNLKRAVARDCLNHASNYPCEYCFAKGIRYMAKTASPESQAEIAALREKLQTVSEEINNTDLSLIQKELEKMEKKLKSAARSHFVWPAETANAEPRTHDAMLEIAKKIEREGKLPPDEAKGVQGMSPLFDLPNFDFMADSPTEYLHCVCLGVTKRMIELTFDVGERRDRQTQRKLSNVALFNELMQCIKVVREFSRRVRELEFALMKGQEYRNIVLFFFPVILSCIEKNEKERTLWLQYAYMIRSCVLSSEEFKGVNLDHLRETCAKFYKLYESLFGGKNCTYNTHLVSSHLIEMRFHGPLTKTSAFGFESFYSEVRQSYTPGTQSTLKQIFKKILLKRKLSHHVCQNSIFYSDNESNLENNTLIYCFKDLTFKIYKIVEIQDDNLLCYQQGKYKHVFEEYPHVDWSTVGVFKKGPISNEIVKISKNDVDGKVLMVENLLITCPNDVLREKKKKIRFTIFYLFP